MGLMLGTWKIIVGILQLCLVRVGKEGLEGRRNGDGAYDSHSLSRGKVRNSPLKFIVKPE